MLVPPACYVTGLFPPGCYVTGLFPPSCYVTGRAPRQTNYHDRTQCSGFGASRKSRQKRVAYSMRSLATPGVVWGHLWVPKSSKKEQKTGLELKTVDLRLHQ